MACWVFLPACQVGRDNPSLPLSATEARSSLKAIEPGVALRPLVILAGWREPGVGPARIVSDFRRIYGRENVLTVNFFTSLSFDQSRARVVEAVQRRWPSASLSSTVEVDVIGHSMGGIVARYAAVPAGADGFPDRLAPTGRRLKMVRCFTIGSPHDGARLAPYFFFDPTARDMMRASQFLSALDSYLLDADFEIKPYVVRGDVIVGAKGASPKRVEAETLPYRFPLPSHLNAMGDPRITADILRRLGSSGTASEP